jgi:hypothetical protein
VIDVNATALEDSDFSSLLKKASFVKTIGMVVALDILLFAQMLQMEVSIGSQYSLLQVECRGILSICVLNCLIKIETGRREERERSPRELANIYREVWHMRSRGLQHHVITGGRARHVHRP